MKKQIIISLAILFLIGTVFASMPLPHAFHGIVTYSDGTLIQESLEITAKINNEEVGSSNIINGKYDLVVESESEGETIYFYIEGLTEAIKTDKFESFEITELDFATTLTNPNITPVNPPSSNSGGSGSSGSGGGNSPNNPIIILNKTGDDEVINNEENKTINLNETEKTTSPKITGAVINFVNSNKGSSLIVVLIIIGIGMITIKKKYKTSKNEK